MSQLNWRVHRDSGAALRDIRNDLGLTLRNVHHASLTLAMRKNDGRLAISASGLFEIETKGRVPSMHRLYALSIIYKRPLCELLLLYGIG